MTTAAQLIQLNSFDLAKLADVCCKLHSKKGFVWLDSAAPNGVDNRYHIISWQPKAMVLAKNGGLQIQAEGVELATQTQKPFAALEELEQQFKFQPLENCDLPFQGGWLGYCAYDLGRYLEQLPQIAEQDLALPDMQMAWYDAALVIDLQEDCAFLVGKAGQLELMNADLQNLQAQPPAPFKLQQVWQANMTVEQYSAKFAQVQEYLIAGDCYQVNLAQRFSALYSGDPFSAYLRLREQNQTPFSAYLNLENAQILSVSPERFISCTNDEIQTKPIKGTRPRKADFAADQEQKCELQNAEKDRAENLMIVDLLRNDLGKVAAAGTVEVPQLFAVESYPAVHHLVSTISAKLAANYSVYDLLAGAFPGGSITGAPKLRSMEIIEELEPHCRSVYCGSIGYISICGKMDTNIAIRTLVTQQNKIYCWAGGGLVADSNCAAEYQETFDKLAKIAPILQEL